MPHRTTPLALLLLGCGAEAPVALEVQLTDAPLDGVAEVNVPVDHVKVRARPEDCDEADGCADGGWHTLDGEPQTIDLLELQGGVTELIGEGELPPGELTELRLVLADDQQSSLVMEDGSEEPLQTPSGASSGLKVKGSIPLEQGETVVVTVDFDAALSVHQTGSGRYLLQPVLRLVNDADDTGS